MRQATDSKLWRLVHCDCMTRGKVALRWSAQESFGLIHLVALPPWAEFALSFLLMIGLSLVAEGFGQHIPKGYIYFAMAFSVFVEMLNLKVRHQVG